MRQLLGLCLAAALLLTGCADNSAQPGGRVLEEPATSASPPAPTDAPSDEPPFGANSSEPPTASVEPRPVPEIEVREAGIPAQTDQPSPPVQLVYEQIGADMPIDPVGVAPDGQMAIPEDAARAGWYQFGAGLSDEQGAIVIAAHAGSYITPRGPLYDLKDSAVGHQIVLLGADDARVTYEVTAVEQLNKTTIDFNRYFAREGAPKLVLITCGGRFDRDRQSYDDNVIVTAVPVQ